MGFYSELDAFGNADRKKYKNLAVADLSHAFTRSALTHEYRK